MKQIILGLSSDQATHNSELYENSFRKQEQHLENFLKIDEKAHREQDLRNSLVTCGSWIIQCVIHQHNYRSKQQ